MKTFRALSLSLAALLVFASVGVAQPRGPRVPDGVQAHRNIEYARVGDVSLKIDVYVPAGATGKLPAVVWVHGGGWKQGSKENPQITWLTQHGYVVASVQYRLSDVAKFPAQIHDVKGAVRFLRANAAKYHIDPERIGAAGASAGGHLVALLGTTGGVKELEGDVGGNTDQSSRVQAVYDIFGPSEFTTMPAIAARDARGPVALLLGGPVSEKPELAALASPVTHVSSDDPPFFIAHGDQDRVVPLKQSQLLEAALKNAKVPVTLHVIAGAGHGRFRNAAVDEMALKFFDAHLKK